jgi:hypothetical protein
MKHAVITGLTNTEPEMTWTEMIVTTGDSLSDLAHTDNGEDMDDENDELTEQDKLREDDEPGRVMSTITKTIQ